MRTHTLSGYGSRLTIFSSQANLVRHFFILMCTHLALYVCQFWMRRNRGSLVSPFARCVENHLRLRLWLIETPCIDRNWYPRPIERPQHQRSGAERCVHHVQVRISINGLPYLLTSKLTQSCCIFASSIRIFNAQERQSCIRVRCSLTPDARYSTMLTCDTFKETYQTTSQREHSEGVNSRNNFSVPLG